MAIHLSDEAEAAVREARDAMRAKLHRFPIRWMADSNLHLTLRFLGHVPDENLRRIGDALPKCTREHKPFILSTSRIGVFKSLRWPTVLWAGIEGNWEELSALQACVENAVSQLAPHEEKRAFLQPHITIARCNLTTQAEREATREAILSTSLNIVSWKVNSYELMRSSLSPKGATYTELARYELGQ